MVVVVAILVAVVMLVVVLAVVLLHLYLTPDVSAAFYRKIPFPAW